MKRENKKQTAVSIMLSGSLEDYLMYLKNLTLANS